MWHEPLATNFFRHPPTECKSVHRSQSSWGVVLEQQKHASCSMPAANARALNPAVIAAIFRDLQRRAANAAPPGEK